MFAAAAGSIMLCDSVRADLSLSFSVDQLNYDASPGQSVSVPIYLQEAVTAPDVSLLEAESGLFSAGVLVQRTGSSLGQPAVITGASANGDFDDFFGPVITLASDQASISIYETRDLGQSLGVLTDETPSGSGMRRILLGAIDVTAGPTVGEVTRFLVGDDISDDWLTWMDFWQSNVDVLDPYIQPPAEFTVTTVPVPASVLLGLSGMSASGILLYLTGMASVVVRRRR
jgi:hypothetical protein